jgi:hypothetical protein
MEERRFVFVANEREETKTKYQGQYNTMWNIFWDLFQSQKRSHEAALCRALG